MLGIVVCNQTPDTVMVEVTERLYHLFITDEQTDFHVVLCIRNENDGCGVTDLLIKS